MCDSPRYEIDRDVIGSPIEDLDTPVLLLDGPASARNIARMAEFFRDRKSQLRPHFKNHKCTTIARRQLAAGSAVGITCAKLGEAEVLADAGVNDVLIANQLVGRRKLARLVDLAGRINLKVAVDDTRQITAISEAASAAGVTVGILIEVNIGMNRCGVEPGEPALRLAREIGKLPGLRFDGIQAYEGHVVYNDDAEQRAELVRQDMQLAIDTRRLIEQSGIPVGVISGGSSSTYNVTGLMEGVDEIQAGTYPTMDWRYAQLSPDFEVALSVLTRVISTQGDRAVLDVGLKGATAEFGLPRIKGHAEIELPSFSSEEHCIAPNAAGWNIGDIVELLPSHACTTCNLHRAMCVHEDGRVVDIWPIEGSGRLA